MGEREKKDKRPNNVRVPVRTLLRTARTQWRKPGVQACTMWLLASAMVAAYPTKSFLQRMGPDDASEMQRIVIWESLALFAMAKAVWAVWSEKHLRYELLFLLLGVLTTFAIHTLAMVQDVPMKVDAWVFFGIILAVYVILSGMRQFCLYAK